MRLRALIVLSAGLLFAGAACSGSPCDPAEIQAQLDGAGPGDVVTVGACRIEGSLSVPASVTLRGQGGSTVLVASQPDGAGVALTPGPDAAPTVLESLTIESSGRVGVLARGAGRVSISDVTIRATRGYALGIESAAATIARVTLEGPIDATNESSEEWITVTAEDTATYGLVTLGSPDASLTDLTIRGFAQYGAVVLDRLSDGTVVPGTTLHWNGGAVADTLGIGVYVSGGTSTLELVDIGPTFRGLRGAPSYAAIFTNAANVTTRGLHVHDSADYGVLHEGGAVVHEEPVIEGSRTAGLLMGEAGPITISGAAMRLRDNGVANLYLLNSHDVRVADGEITGALSERTLLTTDGAPIMLGDGIHLVGTHDAVALENLVLHGNQRVGMLVDLGTMPTMSGITFTNVRVGADGVTLGLIGGTVDDAAAPTTLTPVPPDGTWDAGATREGAALVNDAAWTMALEVAGIVTPTMLPRPDDAVGIVTPTM